MMATGKGWWSWGLALGVLLLTGCPRTTERAYPVCGVVTLDGKPLVGGSVRFEPVVAGPLGQRYGAHGTIQPDGSYRLTTFADDDGAMAGRHRVVVLPDPNSRHADAGPQVIPSRYFSSVASGLEFEVLPGSNRVDIPLVTVRVEVHGLVRLDGKPVAGGSIRFEPLGGATASPVAVAGEIGSDGEYRLTSPQAGNGAFPGRYRVSLRRSGETPDHREPACSTAEVVVKDVCENVIDLEFQSKSR